MDNDPNQQLVDLFQQQKSLYGEIQPMVLEAHQRMKAGEIAEGLLEKINQQMTDVQSLDQQVKQAYSELQQSGQPASEECRTLKNDLTLIIGGLIEQIGVLENQIQSARSGLLPGLSRQVVASKMHRAYSKGQRDPSDSA